MKAEAANQRMTREFEKHLSLLRRSETALQARLAEALHHNKSNSNIVNQLIFETNP